MDTNISDTPNEKHRNRQRDNLPGHQFFIPRESSPSTASPPQSRKTGSTSYTSPTKSLKSFFMNRASAYSIESISEEPEIGQSPSKPSGGVISLLKPSFIKSKSFQSTASSANPITTTEAKPLVEDFADTLSEEGYTYDSESINSILEEYEIRDTNPIEMSSNARLIDKNKENAGFVFQEDFDDSTNDAEVSKKRKVTPLTPSQQHNSGSSSKRSLTKHDSSCSSKRSLSNSQLRRSYSQKSPIDAERSSLSSSYKDARNSISDHSSSRNSAGFKIYNDADAINEETGSQGKHAQRRVKVAAERKNVISASSNVDVLNPPFNLSELDMVVGASSKEYPEPNVTPTQTPVKLMRWSDTPTNSEDGVSPDVSEQPLNVRNIRYSTAISNYDETVLGKSMQRDTFRSSMSSGELLSKLDNFYDGARANDYNHEAAKSTLANLTAGIDSSTELPVTVYTVQDRDFNEDNQRWSVYETREGINLNRPGRSSLRHLQPGSTSSGSDDIPGSSGSGSSRTDLQAISIPRTDHQAASTPRTDVQTVNTPRTELQAISAPQTELPGTAEAGPSSSDYGSISGSSVGARVVSPRPAYGGARGILSGARSATDAGPSPATPLTALVVGYAVPPAKLADTLAKQTLHERMVGAPFDDLESFRRMNLAEKGYGQPQQVWSQPQHQSWSRFLGLMVVGLVVPPVYFLIAAGAFNSYSISNHGQFYSEKALVNQRQVRKYTTTQRLFSLLFGLFWVAVVLAMIGVGLGLGITRERR